MLQKGVVMKSRSSKTTKPAATTGRKRIEFSIEAAGSSSVAVAGTFNDWEPAPLTAKSKGKSARFSRVFLLPPGRYEYKFVVDGEWISDPNCAATVINEHGTLNSCLQVG